MFAQLVFLFWVASFAGPAAARDISSEGRWVDFGPGWSGIVDCESSPTPNYPHLVPRHHPKKRAVEIRADSKGSSNDRGVVQFIPSSWDWASKSRGAWWLVGKDPRTVTLAEQMRNAQWLRTETRGGIGHWACWRRWFGADVGPQWVTGEWKPSPHPFKCARNLRRHHGFRWRHAASICGYEKPAAF